MFKPPEVSCLRYQTPIQWLVLVANPFYGTEIDICLEPYFYVGPDGCLVHRERVTYYDTEKEAIQSAVLYVYREILLSITNFLL